MIALVNSFDSPGFFARNIEDLIHAISNLIILTLIFQKLLIEISDAVAGPDGEDATLLSKSFVPFKTSTELVSKEKQKIVIGLPDVRIIFFISFLFIYSSNSNKIGL